jgi:hypothetical protein
VGSHNYTSSFLGCNNHIPDGGTSIVLL